MRRDLPYSRQRTGRVRVWAAAAWVATAMLAMAENGDAAMRLGINRARIFEGESVLFTVRVSGLSRSPEPDLSGIADADIEFLGSQSQDQVSVTIMGGQVRKSGHFGRLFSYRIKPRKTGEFQVGPVRLVLPGRTLTELGPTIAVQGIEEQDDVIVEIVASRDTVLADEPFDITLRILLKQMPGDRAELDPLDPAHPPVLEVPFLDTQPIAGVEGPDVRALLRTRLTQRRHEPGFAINQYTVRPDPFDEMFRFDQHREPRLARFMLERRAVERNGKPYFEYALTLPYRPEEEGAYTFGPVMFKGMIVRDMDASRRLTTRSVFAVGPAQVVRVIPPPEAGRPLSFIGAIGATLSASAALDTRQCKIGDPLTLTLTVSGEANLRNAQPPPIHAQPDVRTRFRVYPDTVETVRQRDEVRFLYRLRPIVSGTIELPPLAVAYYDFRDRDYRTVWTKPLPLRVDESRQLGVDDILGLNAFDDPELLAEPAPWAPAPLIAGSVGALARPLRLEAWHGALAAAAPTVYGFALLFRWRRRQATGAAARKRKRRALGRALALLRASRQVAESGECARRTCEAMKTFLADRLGIESTGMTPDDARRLLARHGVAPSVAARFGNTLEARFNSAYEGVVRGAGPASDAADDAGVVEAVLRETDKVLADREAHS